MATMYTVKKGDTLSEIAEKYYKTYSKYSTWREYMNWLVVVNDISNPDYIVVGQKLKMDGQASAPKVSTSYKPTITSFGIISTDASEKELYATWSFGHANVKHYVVAWEYCTNSVKWIDGNNGSNPTVTTRYYKFTPPSNAVSVRVMIRPVAKTRKVNGKDTPYWVGQWGTYSYYHYNQNPPGVPTGLKASIEGSKLTATVENIPDSLNAKSIKFQIIRLEDNYKYYKAGEIKNGSVSIVANIALYKSYKVRCCALNKFGTAGEYSDYTGTLITKPAPVKQSSIRCTATSPTSVKVEWGAASTAKSYELEYTTNKEYFETENTEKTKVSSTSTVYEITKLETGTEYFIRIRSINDAEDGESEWSEPVSATVGSSPGRPTTWSSNVTAIVGEPLYLYWVHNSIDKSVQTAADLELTIGDDEPVIFSITDGVNATLSKESDGINSYTIHTSFARDNTPVKWRIRTAGVTGEYSDWSIERVYHVYSRPVVSVKLTNQNGDDLDGVVQSFPFYISALAGPETQRPIGYHVSIRYSSENGKYETLDQNGTAKIVRSGDEVYSKHYDMSDEAGELTLMLTPGSIDLENNGHYTITCTAAMDSGLTAEASYEFDVYWEDVGYTPNAEIVVDEESYSANIRPFCEYRQVRYFEVTYDTEIGEAHRIYTVNEANELDSKSDTVRLGVRMFDSEGDGVFTETWEDVYIYTNPEDGTSVCFCKRSDEEATLGDDLTLSVYRREFDGSFTEIQSNIPNNGSTWVVDPHPALDSARYRIVAVDNSTGAISYCDLPGYPIGCTSVIIQWDEAWSVFDNTSEDALVEPEWTGSLLKLPYNIDVSTKHRADVALVEYIGRKHPVSYYGTQLGETETWNAEIPKSDVDTLYALRRLAIWSGDVYVREPSGSGYWANIAVSLSQKHREVTIPVTLEITRVEGGI